MQAAILWLPTLKARLQLGDNGAMTQLLALTSTFGICAELATNKWPASYCLKSRQCAQNQSKNLPPRAITFMQNSLTIRLMRLIRSSPNWLVAQASLPCLKARFSSPLSVSKALLQPTDMSFWPMATLPHICREQDIFKLTLVPLLRRLSHLNIMCVVEPTSTTHGASRNDPTMLTSLQQKILSMEAIG